MKAAPVSVMIFTLDEELHLPSCLDSVAWSDDVIVVDSFSTDGTARISQERGVRFYRHEFQGFGSQRNWALRHAAPKHPWVLILDADERVPAELARELAEIAHRDPSDTGAFRLRRRFYMWGRWLRYSSLYPSWVVRFVHKDRVDYIDRGHAETQRVKGAIGDLRHDLIDENLKGIDEWFERQNRYSSRDALYELQMQARPVRWRDVLSADPLERRNVLKSLAWRAPSRGLAYFLYSYLWRGGFRDGRDGLVFCRMRALYQTQVAIKKHDLQRRNQGGSVTE